MGDAEAVLDLVTKHNTALVGFADCTLDDLRDELTDPGFDATTDGWVVHDRAGSVIGFGVAFGKGASDMVDLDPLSMDDAVADWLWSRGLARAAEMGARGGHDAVTVDVGIYQTDVAQQDRAAARGFRSGDDVPADAHRLRRGAGRTGGSRRCRRAPRPG